MPTLIQKSRRVRPVEKATFHQVTGAGKSRVQRRFFGLSPKDEDVLTNFADERLQRNLIQFERRSA